MAESLSNMQDPASQGSNAVGASFDENWSPATDGDGLNQAITEGAVPTPPTGQELQQGVPVNAEPLTAEGAALETENQPSDANKVDIVKRDWSGLRKIRAWFDAKFPPLTSSGKKNLYRRPIFWVGVGVVTVGGSALGYVWWSLRTLEQALPNIADMSAFTRDGTLSIKAADGTILLQSGPATREKLQLREIPEQLIKAFIAIEDRRFYEHGGVDYQGIFRAIASNIMARDLVQGGSTITQQLARIVFLNQERSLLRKVREALLAQKIERELNKDQVLERYLNLVYLGSGAYGVADAAWVYFSKPVNELTLAEMATLAGLPPAPSEYSPLVNPDAAKERRNIVLQQMLAAKVITVAQERDAIAQPLAVKPSAPKRLQVQAPYFARYIMKELPRYVSKDALEAGGLTVETSINLEWQKIAEQVMKDAVELDGKAQGFEEAALVSIESRTGEVKAMVGGANFQKSEFNRATQALRQPGSTFKGLVYTAAIAAGFSPYDSYEDGPVIFDGYQPNNYGKRFSGWRSMADALASSVNVVAVKVLVDVGFDPTIKLAHDMGIKSKLNPTYSLALGASEVNLLELTNAYGTLAAQGNYIEAHGIRRVINQRGDVIYNADFKPKRVVDKNSAAIIAWMLQGVVQSGTGGPAALSDRNVAGKTGTSEQARDLWFIGFIPQVVTGIWLGNDDNYPTYGASSTAAYNWREFMSQVVKGMPIEEFPKLPELEGRKGSIKAKPVQPGNVVYGMIKNDDDSISPYNPGGSSHDSATYQDPGSYQEPESYQEPAYQEPVENYN
ncbi:MULTISPECIES: transglycosylase domain-containing protein [Kamptonema]|uniref:transglycosylase domain-containing protein n=1 Tax=Kamptonema TaxID=1501433 RepID=UPI0001DAC9F2|nr:MULTISPECIES: PBP1A family penicillin-binding protein [Kamptonema]CBN57467.1 Penicillin-binding protein 1A [Kamptonema sp. PCC 6506]